MQPDCELGYTEEQIEALIWSRGSTAHEEFFKWMRGHTMAICDGRRFNHTTTTYEPRCNGVAHGSIIYKTDVNNYFSSHE